MKEQSEQRERMRKSENGLKKEERRNILVKEKYKESDEDGDGRMRGNGKTS
jgi:hypothetical protein